jgi:hypothetical protein
MRGYEDEVALFSGRDEELFDILDGLVLGNALADRFPIRSCRTQHVVLRVDENDGCIQFINFHDHAYFRRSKTASHLRASGTSCVPA